MTGGSRLLVCYWDGGIVDRCASSLDWDIGNGPCKRVVGVIYSREGLYEKSKDDEGNVLHG